MFLELARCSGSGSLGAAAATVVVKSLVAVSPMLLTQLEGGTESTSNLSGGCRSREHKAWSKVIFAGTKPNLSRCCSGLSVVHRMCFFSC